MKTVVSNWIIRGDKSGRQAKTIRNVAGGKFTHGFAAREFPRSPAPESRQLRRLYVLTFMGLLYFAKWYFAKRNETKWNLYFAKWNLYFAKWKSVLCEMKSFLCEMKILLSNFMNNFCEEGSANLLFYYNHDRDGIGGLGGGWQHFLDDHSLTFGVFWTFVLASVHISTGTLSYSLLNWQFTTFKARDFFINFTSRWAFWNTSGSHLGKRLPRVRHLVLQAIVLSRQHCI